MNTAPLLGKPRTRGAHGAKDCPYGCCRTIPKDKASTRLLKRRERAAVRTLLRDED